MKNIKYDDVDFENLINYKISNGKSFSIEITGWRCAFISFGLRCYMRHRSGDRWSSLMMVPIGFIATYFWIACVRTEPAHFIISWCRERGRIIVQFEKITVGQN